MKKVNTNKVTAGAVANQAKANNETKTNKKVTKSFKTETKTVQVEITNIQLYDDISVAIKSRTLDNMEYWAYKVQEGLEEMLCFDDDRYNEYELNQMIVDAGLILNLFDDKANKYGNNTYKLCKSIIRMCIHCLDKLEDSKFKETKKPGRISTVKTMSEGLKYTETDDWDDF